jgi:serine/arginine repetitive matrix protein 2
MPAAGVDNDGHFSPSTERRLADETSAKVDKHELLLQAELDIVSSRRSRSRSKSRARTVLPEEEDSDDLSEINLPGAWKSTPVKRKRRIPSTAAQAATVPLAPAETCAGRPWGVAEWKKLERVYRAEKEAWVKEREIKALPASVGWLGWAKKAMRKEDVVIAAWEVSRVVEAFIKGEKEGNLVGKWSR